MRDGGAVPQHPHKVKIVGSNPTPATNLSFDLRTRRMSVGAHTLVRRPTFCTSSVVVTSQPSKLLWRVRVPSGAPRRDLSAIYLSRKHFLSTEVGSQEDKRV